MKMDGDGGHRKCRCGDLRRESPRGGIANGLSTRSYSIHLSRGGSRLSEVSMTERFVSMEGSWQWV